MVSGRWIYSEKVNRFVRDLKDATNGKHASIQSSNAFVIRTRLASASILKPQMSSSPFASSIPLISSSPENDVESAFNSRDWLNMSSPISSNSQSQSGQSQSTPYNPSPLKPSNSMSLLSYSAASVHRYSEPDRQQATNSNATPSNPIAFPDLRSVTPSTAYPLFRPVDFFVSPSRSYMAQSYLDMDLALNHPHEYSSLSPFSFIHSDDWRLPVSEPGLVYKYGNFIETMEDALEVRNLEVADSDPSPDLLLGNTPFMQKLLEVARQQEEREGTEKKTFLPPSELEIEPTSTFEEHEPLSTGLCSQSRSQPLPSSSQSRSDLPLLSPLTSLEPTPISTPNISPTRFSRKQNVNKISPLGGPPLTSSPLSLPNNEVGQSAIGKGKRKRVTYTGDAARKRVENLAAQKSWTQIVNRHDDEDDDDTSVYAPSPRPYSRSEPRRKPKSKTRTKITIAASCWPITGTATNSTPIPVVSPICLDRTSNITAPFGIRSFPSETPYHPLFPLFYRRFPSSANPW